MVDFKTLKKKTNDIEKLTNAVEKESKGGNYANKDEGFWQPEVDKAGNGYAIIRFLPTPPVDGDDGLPWAKLFSHGFKGPGGKWYIENSLTTLGQNDPVSDYNSKLWDTGIKANQEIARNQKRKLSYISNIYVVSDPKHPENDGKVFFLRYGKKIFEKITAAMKPEFEDEKALDPFNFWEGANFKLKIRKVDDYRNYDKSEFDDPSALLGGNDEKLEELYNSLPSLLQHISADKFKTYIELKRNLDSVLGIDTGAWSGGVTEAPTAKLPESQEEQPATAESTEVGTGDGVNSKFFQNLADSE